MLQIQKFLACVFCLQGDMLDFIMAVDDPVDWHRQNLEQNPTHYSFLRYSGPRGVAAVQRWAGQIYYNTRVEMNGKVSSLIVNV